MGRARRTRAAIFVSPGEISCHLPTDGNGDGLGGNGSGGGTGIGGAGFGGDGLSGIDPALKLIAFTAAICRKLDKPAHSRRQNPNLFGTRNSGCAETRKARAATLGD